MASEPPLPQRANRGALLIAPLVGAGLAVVARLQPLRNADLLWQIRSGEEILRRRAPVPVDLYSYAFRGRPIHDYGAGFELLVAALHRSVGLRGLWWATMGLLAAVVALATHASRKLVPSVSARVIGAAATIAFVAPSTELRAELATFAAIGVAHALRRRVAEEDQSRRALALRISPIAIAAIAALFHGLAWCTALVPLVHATDTALARPRGWRRRVLVDAGVALGCVVVVAIASGSAIVEHINELRTPFSLLRTGGNVMPAATLLACAVAFLGLLRLRSQRLARSGDAILFLLLIVPGLRYARFAPLPLFAMMPLAIGGLAAIAWLPSAPRLRTLAVGLPAIACAFAILVITAEYGSDPRTVGFDWSVQPVDAVEYLRTQRPNAALFHPYNYGPYLIFEGYPPRGVVIDSRAEMVYSNEFIRHYYAATSDLALFERWADEAPFDTVLLSRHHKGTRALREFLEKAPRWRVAHEDFVAIVIVRR